MKILKGRGAMSNADSRYSSRRHETVDDGWDTDEEEAPPRLATTVQEDASRTIIAHNRSPDVPFDQSINPYRGCEHGCVYCLSGDTPVLFADGGHKPLRDVKAGDTIIGTAGDGCDRRCVETRVLDHWSAIKPAYRVTLADGTRLTTSADHRFLTEGGWKFVMGKEPGLDRRPHLTGNDRLMGNGRFRGPPSEIDEHRRGYLRRLVSGDGHTGLHTCDRSGRRKRSVAGIAIRSGAGLRIAGIEPLSRVMRMYDISTGTGDFIADGVVSHNCYARPTHAYLGLSPGLDFESRLFYKPHAARLFREALSRPGYRCRVIALGTNTDPYQPIEKRFGVMRSILEVCAATRHPIGITTKSSRIEKDLDLLRDLARDDLVSVSLSVTTLDKNLARRLEPRASVPARRLETIERLADAGIPVSVSVAPVIPVLTDPEMEAIMAEAASRGAGRAGYILLRLPLEVKDLFKEWLREHYPHRSEHVMSVIRQSRQGRENDAGFGRRRRGTGVFAEMIAARFRTAARRLGLDRGAPDLNTRRFRRPGAQLDLDI